MPGPILTTASSVKVTVYGSGTHGSMPQFGVDPVVFAASIVMRLQTIVAREIAPSDTGVITVGSLQAGTKSNIITDRAELFINTRAFSDDVMASLHDGIERIVRAEYAASRSPRDPEFEYYDHYPLTVNDPGIASTGRAAFDSYFDSSSVDMEPVSASEDFSVIPRALWVPYLFWGLGRGADPASALGNHSPAFCPDFQPTLDRGVEALVVAAFSVLQDF